LQVPLVETLIDYGASVAPAGEGNWTSPIETALVFGKHDAAQALVRRGAPVESLARRPGLGRIDDVKRCCRGATHTIAIARSRWRRKAARPSAWASARCGRRSNRSIRRARTRTRRRSIRRSRPGISTS
jgi:hypothetical protein